MYLDRSLFKNWPLILGVLGSVLLASLFSFRILSSYREGRQLQEVSPLLTPTRLNVEIGSVVAMDVIAPTPSPSGPQPGLVDAQLTSCTYNHYYWAEHPEAWLAENIQVGRASYTKSEALAIVRSDDDDVTTGLLRQFFAALLNILQGADYTAVQTTIDEASQWISLYTLGIDIPESERQRGWEMAGQLEEFNLGLVGPGACPDQPATPTAPVSGPATLTPTPTAGRLLALQTPTRTPGPSGGEASSPPQDTPPAGPFPTSSPTPRPTSTRTPTSPALSQQTATPTAPSTNLTVTPTRTPTQTARPGNTTTPTQTLAPTHTPKPTNTQQPTSTPRPTQTLTPTSTPSPTQTLTATSAPSPTQTLTPTSTSSPTQTLTPTSTPSPTPTHEPTPTDDDDD